MSSVNDRVASSFPIEGPGFKVTCEELHPPSDEGLTATVRTLTFDDQGIRDIREQTVVLLAAEELAREDVATIWQERVAAIRARANLDDVLPVDLFHQPPPEPIEESLMEHFESTMDVAVRCGYGSEEHVLMSLREMLQDEAPRAGEAAHEAFIERACKALAAQREREKSWTEPTTNDHISLAFHELGRRGIVALEDAGYTMSDGWSDVAEARGDVPDAWAATFFHRQDVERGVDDGGLMLAFGAFTDGDDHEAESLRAAGIVRDVLKEHGVSTSWDGSIKQRIRIDPFPWRKRRLD